jgi:hypothetical protein
MIIRLAVTKIAQLSFRHIVNTLSTHGQLDITYSHLRHFNNLPRFKCMQLRDVLSMRRLVCTSTFALLIYIFDLFLGLSNTENDTKELFPTELNWTSLQQRTFGYYCTIQATEKFYEENLTPFTPPHHKASTKRN